MSQADVEVVEEFFRTWVNRDYRDDTSWDAVNEILDPDFDYREDPDWPGSATYHGRSAFQHVVQGYYEAFGKMRLDIEEIFDAGDRVLAFIRFWARGESGVEAVMHQAGIFTVREGRLASWQVVFDREKARAAAGLA